MTDQFWTRKQKSDPHNIHTWHLARDRIGGDSSHNPLYNFDHFPGQQFSYMTPPPSYKLSQGFHPSIPNRNTTPVQYIPSIPTSYFSPTSPPPLQTTEDDSGFESLVTNVSDSGSLSSRLVAISPAQIDHPSPYLPKFSDPPYQNFSKIYSHVIPLAPLPQRQFNNPALNGQRSFNQE